MKTFKEKFATRGLPILGAIVAGVTLAGGVALADTGPAISSIAVAPTTNGATVSWTTDQGATAQVLYGTSSEGITPYPSSTTATTGFASTSQSVALTDLNPNTEYFYTVLSGNASGTVTTSTEQTFTTSALSGMLTASPTSGNPGTSFSLSGSGFGDNEFVNLNFNGATSSANANASGTFTTTLLVPSTTVSTDTTEEVMATGGTTGTMASTTFTVTPTPTTPTSTATSSISLNPTSGTPSSTFTVTGTNFQASEGVTLLFEGATSSAQADTGGNFTANLTVPSGAATGSVEVIATGNSSGMSANQWFTVTAPEDNNNPTIAMLQAEINTLQNMVNQLMAEIQQLMNGNGNNGGNGNGGNGGGTSTSTLSATIDQVGAVRAGTSIDFTGRDWAVNEKVQVSTNGNVVTTAQADGGGNFSTGSLPIGSTVGSETYTFTGLSSGLTRTVTVTVTP